MLVVWGGWEAALELVVVPGLEELLAALLVLGVLLVGVAHLVEEEE